MAAPLNFLIELFDKLTGPSNKMSDSLDKLGGNLDKMKGFLAGAESGLTKLASGLHVAHAGFELIRGAGEGALSFLEKIGDNQATQGIFEDMLGKEGGAGLLDWLGRIQGKTAFVRDQLETLAQPLGEFIKDIPTIQKVTIAALDVGRGNFARSAAAVEVFSKLASTGKIKIGAFRALGLNAPEGFKAAGGVGSEAEIGFSIERLVGMIADKSEGILGSRAVKSSETIAAKLNHLRNWDGELLEKLSNSSSLDKIISSLGKLSDTLTAPKFIDSLASIVEKMAGGLPDFLDKLAAFVTTTDWAAVADGFGKFFDVAVKFATFFTGTVADADRANDRDAGTLGKASLGGGRKLYFQQPDIDAQVANSGMSWWERFIYPTGDQERLAARKLEEKFTNLGTNSGTSFQFGFNAALVGVGNAGAGTVLADFAGPQGIDAHSPSRKFMQLGKYAAEGLAIGFDSGPAIAVEDATVSGGRGGRGGSVSITFGDIIIDGAGKDARGLGEELKQVMRDTARDLIDEYGLGAGLVN